MKVLFILHVPITGASTRFRVIPYLSFLESHGIEYMLFPLMENRDFQIVHKPRHYRSKVFILLRGALLRLKNALESSRYDVVYLQREAYPFGPPVFEFLFSKFNGHLLLDIDDAIYARFSHAHSMVDRIAYVLKYGSRTFRTIKWSRQVNAGNSYLVKRALEYNPHVSLMPTAIDTDGYIVREQSPSDRVTIGWMGSPSTTVYLSRLDSVFDQLATRYGKRVRLRVIGAQKYKPKHRMEVVMDPWIMEREIKDVQSFDIGIMPLDETEWSKGRCGTKMLQYMGVGVPSVCSPSVVTGDIITDQVDGLVAHNDSEWIEYLSALIEDTSKRQRIGMNGRATVEEKYSVKVWAPRFLETILSASRD